MKKKLKKLALSRETLRDLQQAPLAEAAGGATISCERTVCFCTLNTCTCTQDSACRCTLGLTCAC